jgi:hypothetical protein
LSYARFRAILSQKKLLNKGRKVDLQGYVDKTTGVVDTMTDLVNGLVDATDLKVGKEGFSKEK